MIIPGEYPLTIIRGLAFDEVIFQCKDENVSVTGTLSPDATGLYVPCGLYNGKPLFILEGSPSYFLYYNPVVQYCISALLTDAYPVNAWVSPADSPDPTGVYNPIGDVYTGLATVTDHPLDLTGFGVEGVIRKDVSPSSPIFAPLSPSVTDPTNGEFTIPGMTYTVTEALTAVGAFYYDIVATNSGERVGILVWGPVNVADNVTQPS